MPAEFASSMVMDGLTGWRGASTPARARLLEALCAGVRPASLVSNSLTLVILAGLIIAQTHDPVHVAWVAAVILGGALPRFYAARLRRIGRYGEDTERKALGFLAVNAVYGLIWGAGPFLVLPEVAGTATGIFLFIMVFGTIMGPYAIMPGILYVRLATTGLSTLVAAMLYTPPPVAVACLVISIWLGLRTDVWRGYHRTLRRQYELQDALEARQAALEAANKNNVEANRWLRHMAETDPLTGAFNRRELMQRLSELSGPAALVLIDIDHFKAVNDSFGHHVGDAVLINLVGLVQETLRRQDVLARLGGEEFAVVLGDSDRESAWALAERLRSRIERCAVKVGEHDVRVTVSVGVTVIPKDAAKSKPTELLREADSALYDAKRNGRNRTEIFAPKA